VNETLPEGLIERLARDGPDAVVFADAAGKIRFWNRSATRIFGFEEQEALGRTLDLIVPEPQRARHWQGYDRVMAGGESRYGEGEILAVPALKKDGRRISVEFTILPVRDAKGAILGIAAFLRDVTRRFEELRALRREVAALRAQTAKNDR
jgi:PAS domain S-box-containing protein